MSPKQNSQTASGWRRTKHLGEALSLISFLDGERTVPEAVELAGLANPTVGLRIMASLRFLATEQPELVELEERREGHKVFHTVKLLPELPPKRKRKTN